jgi:hypothetical protein
LAKSFATAKRSPQPAELKEFIKEYAHELQATQAWQLDAGGESQQLLDEWMVRYGEDGQLQVHKAVGCDKCNPYKGRIGLHEPMIADDPAKRSGARPRGGVRSSPSTAACARSRWTDGKC